MMVLFGKGTLAVREPPLHVPSQERPKDEIADEADLREEPRPWKTTMTAIESHRTATVGSAVTRSGGVAARGFSAS